MRVKKKNEKYLTHTNGYQKPVHRCPLCQKTVQYMHKHLADDHVRPKQLECQICWKEFANTSKVKRHMSVHSHELSFKCKYCGKWFQRQEELSVHILKIHQPGNKDRKRWNCLNCFKIFDSASGLEKHMREEHNENCLKCRKNAPCREHLKWRTTQFFGETLFFF